MAKNLGIDKDRMEALRPAFESWYRSVFDWPTWPELQRFDACSNEEENRQLRLSGYRPGEYQSLGAQAAFVGFCGGWVQAESDRG